MTRDEIVAVVGTSSTLMLFISIMVIGLLLIWGAPIILFKIVASLGFITFITLVVAIIADGQ